MNWTWVLVPGLATLAAAEATVQNDRLAITFDAAGALTSLHDKLSGRELLAPTAAPRWWQVEFLPAGKLLGERVVFTNRDAQTAETAPIEGGVELRYRNLGGRGVDVTCRVTAAAGDPFVRFRPRVVVPADLTLAAVRCPIVTLRAPLEDGRGDYAVTGATKGGIWLQPSAWKIGRSEVRGMPGNLAAQFGCYYDDRGGLLTTAFDAAGYPKALATGRSQDGLELQWYQAMLANGELELAYELGLTTFAAEDRPTDWRDAADLYKAWAVTQPWCARTLAQREDLPEWLLAGPAMVRFNRAWLAQPEKVEAWFRDYWLQRFPGRGPLIVAWWGWEKVETWVTPDYFPVYPDDATFARLHQASVSAGGHDFFWPSGYHYTLTYDKQADGSFRWDDRERFAAVAAPHAVRKADGELLIGERSWLRGGATATLCPGDPWTIDWFCRIGEEIARRGVEIVQVDQVVGAGFPICYSPDHGHPVGPGKWVTDVFRHQLESLLARCRAIQPDAVVGFEEPNEWYLQQVGIQDYRDWEVTRQGGVEPASVFGYLYHEYLPEFQSNPGSGGKLQAAWCLVTGQIPHLVPSTLVGPGPLLVNGGMDDWTGAAPTGWDKVQGWQGVVYSGRAERDETERHGGPASLRLTNGPDDPVVQVSQNVTVSERFPVGGTYRMTGWLKSRGLKQAGGVMLGLLTSDLKSTGGARLEAPREDEGWVHREATFTVPPGTDLLRIMCHLSGEGTMWVDDLRLEERQTDGTFVEVQRPELPPDHELMQQWVELFAGEGRPYLYLGRMLHPPALECERIDTGPWRRPAILHNAFEAPDGSQAVVLVNASDTPQVGRLTWPADPVTVELRPWEVRLLRR